jgi:hypothetical protein
MERGKTKVKVFQVLQDPQNGWLVGWVFRCMDNVCVSRGLIVCLFFQCEEGNKLWSRSMS